MQMFIGDGAKLVRDAFALAKEKSPCIIFIDEIDAIGTKRFDSEVSGDREVQRTMLELLNQLDGFSSDENIKVGTAPCPGISAGQRAAYSGEHSACEQQGYGFPFQFFVLKLAV
jgi:SpoVK/Ycf46/Vps4 family AAA+-type ATPase